MALLILALLQRIFLMSSLMLLLVWLIFFMVLIKLLPILGTISGKTVKLLVLALLYLGNNRKDCHPPNCMLSCHQILASICRWITASSSWKRFCLFVCRALSSIMVICMLTAIRLLLTFVMSLYLLLRS